VLDSLLEEVFLPIVKIAADGAYYQQKVYNYLQKRQIQALP